MHYISITQTEMSFSFPPLGVRAVSDSDMSSESMGPIPSDNQGSSDEDTRSAAVQPMEREIPRRSISSSQRSFSDDSLLSQSCRSTENSGIFTEPSTVSQPKGNIEPTPFSQVLFSRTVSFPAFARPDIHTIKGTYTG